MGLNRLKRGYLIQFKRYVDQLTGSSGFGAVFREAVFCIRHIWFSIADFCRISFGAQ